jgi:hypothetical protein
MLENKVFRQRRDGAMDASDSCCSNRCGIAAWRETSSSPVDDSFEVIMQEILREDDP